MLHALNQLIVSPNITSLDKDRIQSAFWIITAGIAILSLTQNTNERRRELRWKQAMFAKQIIDELLVNEKASEALLMLDCETWNPRTSNNNSREDKIETIKNALALEQKDKSTPEKLEIKSCFYQLLFYINRLEQAIETKLIRFEDVTYPFCYYYCLLEVKENKILKESFETYIKSSGFNRACMFWERLQEGQIDETKRLDLLRRTALRKKRWRSFLRGVWSNRG